MHCNYANVARIHCQSPDTVERWPVLVAIPALLIHRYRVPENIRTPNEISSNHFIKSKSQHSYRFANGAISIFRCVTTAKHRIEMQTVVTFLSHWFTIVTHMICRAIEFVGHQHGFVTVACRATASQLRITLATAALQKATPQIIRIEYQAVRATVNRGSTLPTTIELIAGARCWQHRIQSVRRALETLHLLRPIAYFVFGIEQQIVGATITRGTIVLADEVIAAIGDVTGKTIRAIMARTDFGGWLKCTGAGHTNHSGNGK